MSRTDYARPAWLAACLLLLQSLLLAGCGALGESEPAIYRVDRADTAEGGEPAGWLFGTIHALPPRSRWRNETIDSALDSAGVLMVEIRDLNAQDAQRALMDIAISPGLPPLEDRVAPRYRDELAEVFDKTGAEPEQFRNIETWAAAMTLGSMLQGQSGLDPEAGVDRALIADFNRRSARIVGLETVEEQFTIFDMLSGDDQQALLESLIEDAEEGRGNELAEAWLSGDTSALEGMMDAGFAASPGLRGALLSRRNARWIGRIITEMENGSRPVVAVGAGHMGGPDGLISLLRNRGWRVTRIDR